MKPQLEEKLYQIDPIFFEQAIACKKGLMNQMSTCMAFGCQCGDGWFKPIAELAKKTAILNKLGKEYNIKFVCVQLKQKWGTFTCYTQNYIVDEAKDVIQCKSLQAMFDDAIKKCEEDCYNVCEFCGASGGYKNQNMVNTSGWIHRICRDCSQKQMIESTKMFDEKNNQEYISRITLFKQGFYFLNMAFPCSFEYKGKMYKSIIQAYISQKDVQHRSVYTTISNNMQRSAYVNYTVFKSYGGTMLEEDYDLIKDIVYNRFAYWFNRNDLQYLLKTDGYLLQEMGKHCDNIFGHCVCDKCKDKQHKDLYAKILMEVRKQLVEQNNKKRDDVAWSNDNYYIRDEKGEFEKVSLMQFRDYQRVHNIKDDDIRIGV